MSLTRPFLLVAIFVIPGSVLLAQADAVAPTTSSAPMLAAVPDLSGCWSGYWISCKNGHKGPLHAEFCKINDTCYRVSFRGKFWKVFPFRYSTTMTVTGYTADGQVMLTSREKLGPILGTFCMTATASNCHFEANFTSKNDHGKFILNRD